MNALAIPSPTASPAAFPVPSTTSARTSELPPEDVAELAAPVRAWRAVKALRSILADPDQTKLVLEFSNLVNASKLTERRRAERLRMFHEHPVGKRLFEERRALDSTTVDLEALSELPEGTLGRAYADFMRAHGITPHIFDGRPQDVKDERAAYVIQRMRQTHDLWHVVANVETDPAGEIALQAFTFAQVGAPSAAILAVLGTLRTLPHTRRVLREAIALYWRGREAERFAVFPWEDHWSTPLVEVRRLLGMPLAPERIGGYTEELLAAAYKRSAAA